MTHIFSFNRFGNGAQGGLQGQGVGVQGGVQAPQSRLSPLPASSIASFQQSQLSPRIAQVQQPGYPNMAQQVCSISLICSVLADWACISLCQHEKFQFALMPY